MAECDCSSTLTAASPTRVALRDLDELTLFGLAALIDHEHDMTVISKTVVGQLMPPLPAGDADVVVLGLVGRSDRDTFTPVVRDEVDHGIPVLAVVDSWRTHLGVAALQSGVRGMALRSDGSDVIVRAVREIARGLRALTPSVADRVIRDVVIRGPQIDPAAARRLAALTRRESEILALMVRGLSPAVIAAELSVSGSTVKSHVCRMLGKLGLKDKAQAVALAHTAGILFARTASGGPLD